MALKIYPYNMNSESAKDLAQLLNVMRIRPDGNFIPKHFMKILNWGSSRVPDWASRAAARSVPILNKPANVAIAVDKLLTLKRLSEAGVRVPEFTTNVSVAGEWLRRGATVMERHELRGNSGDGIRVVNFDDEEMESNLTSAPLYTKFIPKTAEFRVHVFNGEVIDYIQKLKISSERRPENFNKYISSVNYGWVFSRTGIRDMPEVRQIAIQAVRALGLDFGAVDVVFADGLPFVLEVNCSPGLAGTTLVKYGNALRRYMGLSDLPADSVQAVMARTNEGTVASTAAPVAQVSNQAAAPLVRPVSGWAGSSALPTVETYGDTVTLHLDRATAVKLKNLLASVGI